MQNHNGTEEEIGDLRSRVALVTGSTSGIGHGIANSLASKGCSIILNGFGEQDVIEKIRAEIQSKYDVRVDYVGGDLSKLEEITLLCQQVDSLYPDGIDILINNAGIQHVSPVDSFPVEKWDYIIAVMLTAPFHLIQHFLPKMKQKAWGRIVNIGSVHSLVASLNKAAYCSSKHGLLGLTKVVALETAGSGVTCNIICPGFVETEIFIKQAETRAKQDNCSFEEAKRKVLQVHPSQESIKIKQVGDSVAFLCSPAADQMTGSPLVIDGGWSAR